MSPPLPDRIEPKRLAARDVVLSGQLQLKAMPRLRAAVLDEDGEIEVQLNFHRDEEGRIRASGRVGAILQTTCQRCLERMELDIEETIDICFLPAENAQVRLPHAAEPVLLEQGQVALAELIEDQLLLALPFAPMHATGVCQQGQMAGAGQPASGNEVQCQNPFAILAGLKGKADRED